MSRPRSFEIIIGHEYGRLTVLAETEKDKYGHMTYLTRCRCGKEHIVQRQYLRKANPMCRECSIKNHPAKPRLSKPGDVLNGWRIVEEIGKNEHGAILYRCECLKCGTVSVHTRGDLTARHGNGCQYCKPDYHFRFDGDTAIGTLPNGMEFLIDAGAVSAVSAYHWSVKSSGYIYRTDKNLPKMMLHWFVLGLEAKHDETIDHINRNKLDCRCSNLRIVTPQQNSMNKSISKNNTSGYVGVCFVKSKSRYMASIGFNNRKITLGYSSSPEECAKRYNYASELLFGEYAGHRNPVAEADSKAKTQVEEKLRHYLPAAIIARIPAEMAVPA